MTPKKVFNSLLEGCLLLFHPKNKTTQPGELITRLSQDKREVLKDLKQEDVCDLRDEDVRTWAEQTKSYVDTLKEDFDKKLRK